MSTEVRRDAWGIPHLRAAGPHELVHAQGRNAARDRAWQLEVERHRAKGTTAAFLGPDALEWDLFVRRARLDDTARRCYAALDPETAAWVRAYVDGVNAGLPEGAALAPEFAAAGVEPGRWEPWTPLGVWISTHILFAGFPTKLWREEVARRIGEDALTLFATDGPGAAGSNGWLVAGGRTAAGGALLAGDPHRFVEAPGVYQQIHLSCPEFDVVGLAVPGVPGIGHFGHTGHVAWAITNAMSDYQDLYRERLRRTADGGVEALGPDGWRPAAAHTETVEVAGADPVAVEVVETDRGPVIVGGLGPEPGAEAAGGPAHSPAISLRYPPRVTRRLGFEALPALLRARTVDDVDRAFDRWAEPVNVVQAADTAGGLLHRVAGFVPKRHRDNGLRVVSAWEPGHDWGGAHPLPRAAVAADGVAVMANQRGIAAPLGTEFAPAHRADRITELLTATDAGWTAKDMAAVHTDTHLASAAPLIALLADLDGLSPAATALRDRLVRWDRRMDAGSHDASAYAAVRAATVHRLAAHPALTPLADVHADYPALFAPWLFATGKIAYALEGLLTTSLLPEIDRAEVVRAAVEEAVVQDVPWGELHRVVPWQALPDADAVWPGVAGDHDCVLSTSSVPGVTHGFARGPSARYVWDLARREDSLWIVPLGASGVPGDPHALDQLPLWAGGELVPVVTDPDLLTPETGHPQQPPRRDMPTDDATPVFEQHAPGLGTVTIAPVDPDADAGVIHSWVSQERARFWGMNGATVEEVRDIYAHLDSLTTHHGFLLRLDGRPVALLQTYEPAADRVSECYEALPGDLGIHLLLGPPQGGAVQGYTAALLPVMIAFAFADPSVSRVVVEPDTGNDKAVERMRRSGFTLGPEVVLPEVVLPEVRLVAKKARLAFLERSAAEGL
ncbi:GNAT family N-acetyltransferase [Streptomyces sp. NPDC060194]|uniref:GNAT family N-acetyltransferase n=1 Tax=Streptomyces sp. NPDC060194 TaxID=3347069 RepID=UPI00364A2075